jgi:hypothetical protein
MGPQTQNCDFLEKGSNDFDYNVAYLLKERAMEPEKQPLLGNGSVTRNTGITVEICVFCAVRADAT